MLDRGRNQSSDGARGAARGKQRPRRRRQMTGVAADPWEPGVLPIVACARVLARYHRHRVAHLERLGEQLRAGRRVVMVGNHTLDLIDPLLFVVEVLRRYRRIPRFIGHENFVFKMPILGRVAETWGVVPSRAETEAAAALERDGFLMLFPGAGTEAMMRDLHVDSYRLRWKGRLGFLRLALQCDAELMFVAAVGNDEMYYQSRLEMPQSILKLLNGGDAEHYKGARLQFGLCGPHLLPGLVPLPVQISHVVSPPLDLGDRAAALADASALRALHRRVTRECQSFLTASVAAERARADRLDRTVRMLGRVLYAAGL